FVADYEPTKADSYRKQVEINDVKCTVDILDTAGQEDYHGIRDFYYRAGEGFLLVFALDDRHSFETITEYISTIRTVKNNTNLPMVLVGNKSDLVDKRQVSTEDAQALARSLNIPYVETSARTRANVDKIFFDLCVMLAAAKAPVKTNETGKPKKNKRRGNFRCAIL
ncbi:hypothetical protein Ciccas_014074, partial [Cichlidogyrus casuarinus]